MFATLHVAADLAGSFTVSDRTEVAVRAPGSGTAALGLDADTAVTARLSLGSTRWRYGLGYLPKLTISEIGTDRVSATLFHGGEARIEWSGRFVRLTLDESGGYGGLNFSTFSLTPGPTGAPPRLAAIPTQHIIESVSSTTTLGSHITSRRWTFDTSAGYQISGGASEAARRVLPLQKGPFAQAAVSYSVARGADLTTTISASEASFSSGPESILAEVTEGWKHLWSRVVETRLAVGASQSRSRKAENAPYVYDTYPVVDAVLERIGKGSGHVGARFGVRLGPSVNRLLGTVDQRLEGTVAFTYPVERLATHVLASASQSIEATGADASTLVAGEVGAAFGVNDAILFDGGLRALWQRQQVSGAAFLQGGLFLGVTFRAPPIRL